MGWWIAVVSSRGDPRLTMEVPSKADGMKFLGNIKWLVPTNDSKIGHCYTVDQKAVAKEIRKKGIHPMTGLICDEVMLDNKYEDITRVQLIETKMFQPVLVWDFHPKYHTPDFE